MEQQQPAFAIMTTHGLGQPAPVAGRLVLSQIGGGESMIVADAPALKIVLEGEEVHEIEGHPYRVTPGQFLLVEPGKPYRVTTSSRDRSLGMCAYLPFQTDVPAHDCFVGRALLQTVATPAGRRLLSLATRLHRFGCEADELTAVLADIAAMRSELVSEAAARLDRFDVRKPATRHLIMNRLETARAHLHTTLDRAVSLDELARIAGMSSFHLARHFSEIYGAPPTRYHRRVRLDAAAAALRRGDASVTEVALAHGYGELSAFTHAFRREFDKTPREAMRRSTALKISQFHTRAGERLSVL